MRTKQVNKRTQERIEWHKHNPSAPESYTFIPSPGRTYQLKTKFNMTSEEYIHRLDEQHNMCAICRTPFTPYSVHCSSPVVDHNHTTNEVRGVLCHSCNKGLGFFNDNIQTLRNAIEYLKVFQD